MLRRAMILVAALALPIVLPAQRGRNMNPAAKASDRDLEKQPRVPEAKQFEWNSPAAVLLDKKKKLSLSDSQIDAIKLLRKAAADSSALNYAAWDSVRAEYVIASGSASADPEALAARRRVMQLLYQNVKVRNEWARAEALKILTAEQRPKAIEFWDDAIKDDEKWMAGRGGGGGRRPPAE